MNRAQRLQQYYDFDPSVMAAVDEAATIQNRSSFRELADQYEISNGSTSVMPLGSKYPIEVLKLQKSGIDYDDTSAKIYHTAFAYPVNENTAMHALRLFAADPSEQLFVFGNPSAAWKREGRLTAGEIADVAKYDTLQPVVAPMLRYLEQSGITQTSHLGYSYGADKAATAVAHSSEHGQIVDRAVLIEPVSVVKRSMTQLAKQFMNSGSLQKDYIEQTDSQPYDEIWEQDSMLGFAAWASGFVRPSNLAIAGLLAKSGFRERAHAALKDQEHAELTVGWGSASELCPDTALQTVANGLRAQYGGDRVHSLRLQGMHHAGVDDIDLHAAVMLQGLTAK